MKKTVNNNGQTATIALKNEVAGKALKGFIMGIILIFTFTAAKAQDGITVAPKGSFHLGVLTGAPRLNGWNARMPVFSTDFSGVISSGFIRTKLFGANGSVDLGGYYGFSAYSQHAGNLKMSQHSLLVRSAFHFQFLQKMDTYIGVASGGNIRSYHGAMSNDASFVWHLYGGLRYYLTDRLAIKVELIEDFSPWISAGVHFKF
jgi:hypothetical protein